jgi:hypothetical protein
LTQKTAPVSIERAPTRRPLGIGGIRSSARVGARACGSPRCVAIVCSVVAILCPLSGRAGHESPFYPSFYPQEIRIETLDPVTAAAEWPKTRVHAYVGDEMFAGIPVPADATAVASLRSYVVLTFDAIQGRYAVGRADPASRCTAAHRILPVLVQPRMGYVFHPYPVTPYHADYLEQFDLAHRALLRYGAQAAGVDSTSELKIRTKGRLAETLIPPGWKADPREWDATLEEIDLDSLVEPEASGPDRETPWIKQGWYQARLLYAQRSAGGATGLRTEHTYRRLVDGEYRNDVERINMQRSLVTMLVAGCERVVVGYTLRHEYFNTDYSNGVEDVAFDSQAGLLRQAQGFSLERMASGRPADPARGGMESDRRIHGRFWPVALADSRRSGAAARALRR